MDGSNDSSPSYRCADIPLARQIGSHVAADEKTLGALGPGKAIYVESASGNPTSFHIPTITYIYADDDLLDEVRGPRGDKCRH